ncbi:NYN domain-containing protein [Lysobacter capsici]|nr:NYN domain-containing protein [Lysobacter capsici]
MGLASEEKRIALLIDADNAPAAKIEVILAEVARYGVANVRRAYGDWKSPNLKSWEAVLHEFAIRPIQQFAYSKGKNASDMAMVIDAMDLLYARNLDGFAIVSSDADFTPLVMRLLTDGVKVYGFGEKKTPEPFVNACSKFTYVEGLGQPASEDAPADEVATTPPRSAKDLRGDTRLVQMLRRATDSASGDDGWSRLATVGQQVGNQASFDPRNYGYPKLSDLIEAMGLFEIRRDQLSVWIRDKNKSVTKPVASPVKSVAEPAQKTAQPPTAQSKPQAALQPKKQSKPQPQPQKQAKQNPKQQAKQQPKQQAKQQPKQQVKQQPKQQPASKPAAVATPAPAKPTGKPQS